jgi:hypothetical protein
MSTRGRDPKERIAQVVDALDDVPVSDEDAKATVDALGIDVKALATGLRAKVAQADSAAREQRVHEARQSYAAEVERLERRRPEVRMSREDRTATFVGLLGRIPPAMVLAAHFHKYDSASDEELAELTRALRHLLDEPLDDDDE